MEQKSRMEGMVEMQQKNAKYKKRHKKTMATALLVFLSLGILGGCGGSQQTTVEPEQVVNGEQKKIGVVQLMTHGALDAANQGFVKALQDYDFVNGENITIDQQNAQGEQANLQTIAQRFVSNEVDLICAIATPAAQVMASSTEGTPIVGTAITDYVEANLVESNEVPGFNVTGTSDLNPITDQIDLLLQLVPQTKTIGVIYTSSEVNSQIQVEAVKNYAQELNLTVVESTISNINDMQQAAQNLVGKVDAIYLPTDNNVASTMPQVISITDEAGLVTVCGEASMVSAGGTATYGVNYYNLGYQTGVMAARILKGEAQPANMPIEFAQAEDLTVTINQNAIDALGIIIPDELKERAEIVTTTAE